MRLPRPRFTIMGLMILVVTASLVLTGILRRIERNRRVASLAALQVALVEYKNAKLTREVAEIAAEVGYTREIFKQDVKETDNEIAVAEMYLDYAANFRGSDEQTLSDARAMLQKARKKKRTGTVRYTARKTKEELKSEVAKALAAEQAAKAAHDQLQAAVANAWR